jgi:MoaA/NifB/PqqE/SkfB family radical SAM enzyme
MLAEKKAAAKPKYLKIHNFIHKVLQKSIFRKLTEYVEWRIKVQNGEKEYAVPCLAPASINLDLATACNFDCTHCIDAFIKSKGEKLIPFEKVKAVIDYWTARGLKSIIVIGGGEPTVHPDFEEAILYIKSKKLQLGIVSNGSKMEKIARIAPLLGRKDWVRLSLDAGTDETFRKIHKPRGNVNYDKILADVKAVRKKYRRFQMGFSFLIIAEEHEREEGLVANVGEISLAVRKARDHGFTYFSVKPYISTKGQRPTMFSQESLKEIRRQIQIARKYETKTFRIKESLNLTALFDGSNQDLMVHPKVCHSQAFRLVALPNGIYNCTLWRGFDGCHVIDFSTDCDDNFFRRLQDNLAQSIENFDPTQKCAGTSCIYHELNWFIEDLINHPGKLKRLKSVKDFQDYFL